MKVDNLRIIESGKYVFVDLVYSSLAKQVNRKK